ncbi:MAG: hypothetical protein ACI4MH_00360 [Candidatus Coproplasma sp.]
MKAALKLNGCFAGFIDLLDRRAEIDTAVDTLAEIIPADNSQPLNFMLNQDFFVNPPKCAEVYLTGGDAVIYVKNFPPKDGALKVIRQTRFADNLITLYSQGGVQLCCEGQSFELYDMDPAFAESQFREEYVGGKPVLIISAKGCIAAVSEGGKLALNSPAESYTCGDMLEIAVRYPTCANIKGICRFSYDGQIFTLADSRAEETRPPERDILHFAFFESVLMHADYSKYLTVELKAKAALLPSFLGDFSAVTLPLAKFYAEHGNIRAAGLVYPKSKNLFEIKYFAVDFRDGLIDNIYEVE